MKRDFILYIVYCIGVTLIGVLVASGWHDFSAALHVSTGTKQMHRNFKVDGMRRLARLGQR
jgi:hypothetical protein